MRVRKRGQNGSNIFFETHKTFVRNGVYAEFEHLIYERDYERAIRHLDPNTALLRKKRYCFVWNHQYFELDFYEDKSIIPRLEIEMTEENADIDLPPFLPITREITNEDNMSNYDIAVMLKNAA